MTKRGRQITQAQRYTDDDYAEAYRNLYPRTPPAESGAQGSERSDEGNLPPDEPPPSTHRIK